MGLWWGDFTRYIHRGDDEKVMELLQQVTASQMCGRHGNTLLHYASQCDREIIAKHLIAVGCNINAKNQMDRLPLEVSIQHNSTNVTKVLIDAGAILDNSHYANRNGPLHIAIRENNFNVIEMLIKAGCDVNGVNRCGETPLHLAVQFRFGSDEFGCRYDTVKMLIEAGSAVNKKDTQGKTPLHFAVSNFEVIELLIIYGAEIHVSDLYGETPLLQAVSGNHYESAMLLIRAGGSRLDWADLRGNTSLHFAVLQKNPNMVKLLLEKGASVHINNRRDLDPLGECLTSWSEFLFDTFDYECDSSVLRDYDEIIDSECLGQVDELLKCVKLLLKHGANINRSDVHHLTPLYIVLSNDFVHSKILLLLLNNGATFDFKNSVVQRVIGRPNNDSKIPYLLIRHAVMYETQNRSDGPLNLDSALKLNKQLQDYYVKCKHELELMKTSRIFGSTSFFNILFDKNIISYARNELIAFAFETQSIRQSFPIFCDLLTERFSKERKSQLLIQEATRGLSFLLGWNENSMAVIFDNILRFLNKKDFKNLKLV